MAAFNARHIIGAKGIAFVAKRQPRGEPRSKVSADRPP